MWSEVNHRAAVLAFRIWKMKCSENLVWSEKKTDEKISISDYKLMSCTVVQRTAYTILTMLKVLFYAMLFGGNGNWSPWFIFQVSLLCFIFLYCVCLCSGSYIRPAASILSHSLQSFFSPWENCFLNVCHKRSVNRSISCENWFRQLKRNKPF